jgi:cell division protease FtsH
VNEAALLAARLNKDRINMADFEIAKDKVLMGTERRSLVMSEREKRSTAYHEAGHTLVAKLVPGCDPVHKVSIIPRGRALGLTQQLPSEDRHNISKDFAQNQIAVALGGRIAEELMFGEQTTGAGNDFEVATEMARRMVCEWGMSDRVGPLTVGKREEHPFLGREVAMPKTFSEQTAQLIDSEVRRIMMEQYERARTLIQDNMEMLKRIAETLLEFETLDHEEINTLLRGETPVRKTTATARPSASAPAAATSPGVIGVAPTPKGQPAS